MEAIELLNKSKNKLINVVVVIIALIIAGRIYKGQVAAVDYLKSEIELERKTNQVLGEINSSGKRLDAYSRLLSVKETGLLLNNINDIAQQLGVKITSIKPAPERRYPEYVKFTFDLSVTAGNYHTLGKFISKIENSRDVHIIEGLDIKSNKGKKELNANLKISAISVEK